MKKTKYFTHSLLVIGIAVIFSSSAYAQRSSNHSNSSSARSGNNQRNSSQTPHHVASGNGRENYNHPNNHPAYKPTYRPGYQVAYHPKYYSVYRPVYRPVYHPGYAYYPRYYYRPVYRSPYVYPHFGPAFGVRISILPFGYHPFYVGNNPFYFYQGVYYRPNSNGGYEVVAPPLGATVKHLPKGAKLTVINGEKYYELGGTFYQEEITSKNKLQYVVVGTDGVINTIVPDDMQAEDVPGSSD